MDARVKLQFSEPGEDGEGLFQLRWVWLLVWFCTFGHLRSGTLFRDRLLFLGRLRLLAMAFVMLFLANFLGVRDVSWVSHRSNIKLRTNGARPDCLASRR